MLAKDAASQVAAQTALAHDIDGLMRVQLVQMVSKTIQRDIDKALGVACGILPRRSCVQQNDVRTFAQVRQILVMELLYLPRLNIFGDKASHVHRVLCRGIRRRVGEIQLRQIRRFHPCLHGGCNDVDALIHPVKAHDLRTQYAQRFLFVEQFDGHRAPARIIGRMICRGQDDLFVGKACLLCRMLIDTGCSGRHVKHFDDGRGIGSAIRAV